MKPRRIPANLSAQHIWKRLALMPSKNSAGPGGQPGQGSQAEGNLTPHRPAPVPAHPPYTLPPAAAPGASEGHAGSTNKA